MRKKHNKKRNTAFLYELLVRELTKSLMEKDFEKRSVVASILKEHFAQDSVLYSELDLYKTLLETKFLNAKTAEKLLHEVKENHRYLDKKKIFSTQTSLIKKINKHLGNKAWNSFIPNFKALATVSAVFNPLTSIKQRVLYEETLLKEMSDEERIIEELKPVDNLVYRSFVEKYNEEYDSLMEEQKALLSKYITSFTDNGIELKIYLNEEIRRLKEVVVGSTKLEDVRSDKEMFEKTNKVVKTLENFKNQELNKELVLSVLKIQNLAREIQS